MLCSYSLGLALPFLATGLFFERLAPFMDYMKRHGRTVRIVSGLILVAMGSAMAAGSLPAVSSFAVRTGSALRNAIQASPLAIRYGIGGLLAIPAILAGYRSTRHPAKVRGRSGAYRLVAAMFTIAAILQVTGIIDLASLAAGWLLFSGA
jgi:hypothetical protein